MRRPRPALAATALALLLAACSPQDATPPEPAAAGVPSAAPASSAPATPADGSTTLWLCRPGLPDNPCEQDDLDATVVDGSDAVQEFAPAQDPPLDCFYVYPTVSRATGLNAPMAVAPELVAVARAQAARFGEVCRLFAPVYRQITVSAIVTGRYEDPGPRATAERDVQLAFEDYLARDNGGRGVVLVGHSQGARTLTALLQRVEEDPAVRDRVVSALLVGGDVEVPTGADVGGSFRRFAACREPGQTGCVVAYSAYAEAPPPDAFFGVADRPGREVLCTDPSRLGGRPGELDPYLPTSVLTPGLSSGVSGVATGFAAYPGQLRASCRRAGPVSYLHVERAPGARIPVTPQPLGPRWGLHNADVNLALGDLVEVVRLQGAAAG